MARNTRAEEVAQGNNHVSLIDAVKWIGTAYLVIMQEWLLLGLLLVIYFVLIGSVRSADMKVSV